MKFTLNLNKKEFSMKKAKMLSLTASLVLAMAFTFSCSGDDGGGNEPTSSSNSSGTETVFCKQNSGACSQFSLSTCMELVNAGVAQIVSSCDEPPPPPPPPISSSSTPSGNGSSSSNTNSANFYCNGSPYNPSSQFCFGLTIYQKCNGEEYIPIAIGGERTCIGNELHIVAKIGTQTWMKENLDYNASGSKCYDNDPTNCSYYGRLYDWNTARTICPSGWHLPSQAEWTTLINYAGGSSNAGSKLMGRTNDYNFSALPGGYFYGFDIFSDVGNYGYWWSASEYDKNNAYGLRMNLENVDIQYYGKLNLLSVRCLQN